MRARDTDFAALFDHMSDPAIIMDGAGEIIRACNLAFSALAARTCDSVIGVDVSSILKFNAAGGKEANGYERATVFVNGEHPLPVYVERLACHWQRREAILCIVRHFGRRREGIADNVLVSSAEMAALFDYLHEATEQFEAVNQVVATVNSSRTIDQVFSLASEQMRALVPFDRASIALCEDNDEHLRVFALSGEHPGSLSVGAVAAMRGSVTEHALKQRKMVVIPELSEEKRFNVYPDLEQDGFRAAVCCPLFSTHGPIGSLNLNSCTPDAFKRKHLLALERLAPPLAIAIEKVLLLEQAERRSREMEAAARREELAGRIGRQLLNSLDPAAVLPETVDALGRALGADRCHITLFDGDDEYALIDYEYLARRDVASMRGHRVPLRQSAYAQRVFTSGEPLATVDFREVEKGALAELYERFNVRAALAAPLIIGGAQRGLLELHDCTGARQWTEDDRMLLGVVAREVSVALTNAELYEAGRRRREELEGLYKISRAFSTLTDSSEIYGRLTRAIAELVGGEMCLFATYDRKRKVVRAEAPGYQTPPQLIKDFHFRLDQEGASLSIYSTGESFFSNDPTRDARFNQDFIARYGIRSILCVPMRIKRELIGFIYVANHPGGFRAPDVQLLEIFATQAAETIANARLFATIQAQAEREAIINRLLLSLRQMSDPKRAIEIVVERIAEVLELDRCLAFLFGENEPVDFYGEWCADGIPRFSDDSEARERWPVPHWIKTHRQPLITSDVRGHSIVIGFEDLFEKMNLKGLAVVPIMHQGRVVGALSAHQTRRRRWTEDDVDLLTAVATHVGSTLDNARLISELREANRLKDEFLATLSHELRTPLTAIKGWVDLLSESEALQYDEELADGIGVIKNSADSLAQLISDLLDLSRIQRKVLTLDCKFSDINQTVLESTQAVRQAAVARHQQLQLELNEHLPAINIDTHRMQQVLWNLLNNAIKFTPEGGRITVRSRIIDTRGILLDDDDGDASGATRWIVVEVEDTGEGIPQDFLPYVWDRFRQADGSSTRRHGGLGIGLALVKELVEAHGGQVEAKSEGRGATFTVRLPVPKNSLESLESLESRESRSPLDSPDSLDSLDSPDS